MSLAIFDLDQTLLGGDSDYLWGCFLVEQGVLDAEQYAQANERFYADYRAGCLDIDAFLRFSLAPLRDHEPAALERWRRAFMAEKIAPILQPAATALLDRHRRANDRLLIITATNSFVTAPIAARLGVADLIATEPERIDGRFTGHVAGEPAFREGKVNRLRAWLAATGLTLDGSFFYSDSINDLPLLEAVTHPVAVDPDPGLAAVAAARGWPRISLRAPLTAPTGIDDVPPG